MKRCQRCGCVKPLSDFYREKGCRDGHRPECKTCNLAARKAKYLENPAKEIARVKQWQRRNPERVADYQRRYRAENKIAFREGHLRRKFAMTIEAYEAMLAAQGGVCAICGEPPNSGESLHVDHHDERGGVRGILCVRCNNALGQLREDVSVAERAVDYLESNGFARTGVYELHVLAVARAKGLVKAAG
jgi:hypothetical protein